MLPEFNLDTTTAAFLTDDEESKEIEKGGKWFEPGHYDLVISSARFTKPTADSNWYGFVVELTTGVEGDERSIRSYHMIPLSQNIMYQKPGGKPTIFCWSKMTRPFLLGIGEDAKQSTIAKILSKYFAGDGCTSLIKFETWDDSTGGVVEQEGYQLNKLIGKRLEVDLGYEGAYIGRREEFDDYAIFKGNKVVSKEGKELIGDSFDECIILAEEFDINLTRLSVVKIYPKKIQSTSQLDNL